MFSARLVVGFSAELEARLYGRQGCPPLLPDASLGSCKFVLGTRKNMKRFKSTLLVAAVFVATITNAVAAPIELKLDSTKTNAPINPFIYGQFIEHLGRCIYGGIWAEMLEDRKFYFPITANYSPYRSLTNTPFPVVGASPWQIIGDASAVAMVKEDAFVGDHSPRINAVAGIRQRDLGLVAGKT